MTYIQKFYSSVNLEIDDEVHNVNICVRYVYHPPIDECGPSFSSGGQPSEPAEVEILKITAIDSVNGPGGFESGANIINLISETDFEDIKDTILHSV